MTFDGKAEAQKLDTQIIAHINSEKPHKKLAIIVIGKKPESLKYAQLKHKLCNRLGVDSAIYNIPENLEDISIKEQVTDIVNSPEVSSVIIQMPLPRTSLNNLLEIIPIDKDVDLLSCKSRVAFEDKNSIFIPPTVKATSLVLSKTNTVIKGRRIFLIGNSFLVGQPLKVYFHNLGANVTVTDNYRRGDYIDAAVVVSSTGIPNLVDPSDICPNAVVIDFGSSILNGKLTGDIETSGGISHFKMFSPSPGGVGPLVVRYLIMNHLGI